MAEDSTRSTFVTVLAWIFIFLGGFATLIAILQNVMLFLLFPRAEMEQALQADQAAQQMPAFAQFMFSSFEFVFLGFLVVALVTFISAIGLLKRKDWARRVFIGVLSLGIIWNIGGFILQQVMMSHFAVPADAPPHVSADLATMALVMRVFGGIITLALSILFGWLVWRLMSPRIKGEFNVSTLQHNVG